MTLRLMILSIREADTMTKITPNCSRYVRIINDGMDQTGVSDSEGINGADRQN